MGADHGRSERFDLFSLGIANLDILLIEAKYILKRMALLQLPTKCARCSSDKHALWMQVSN